MKTKEEILTASHAAWWFTEKLTDLQDMRILNGREKQKLNNLIGSIDILERKVSQPFEFNGNLADRIMITHDIFDSICLFIDSSGVEEMQELFKLLGLDSKYGVEEKG